MNLLAVIQLVLGLEPMIAKGIADIRIAVSSPAGASAVTYEVYVQTKAAIVAADKAEATADLAADKAALAQPAG